MGIRGTIAGPQVERFSQTIGLGCYHGRRKIIGTICQNCDLPSSIKVVLNNRMLFKSQWRGSPLQTGTLSMRATHDDRELCGVDASRSKTNTCSLMQIDCRMAVTTEPLTWIQEHRRYVRLQYSIYLGFRHRGVSVLRDIEPS